MATIQLPASSGGTPKLRDSCLGCASSKVRCPRQKPSCSRCVKRNIRCEYLASRRAGRKHDDSDGQGIHGSSDSSIIDLLLSNTANLNALFAAGASSTTTAPDAVSRLFPALSNWLAPNATTTSPTTTASTAAVPTPPTRSPGASPTARLPSNAFHEGTITANTSQQSLMSLLSPASHGPDEFQPSVMPYLSADGTDNNSLSFDNFDDSTLDFAMSSTDALSFGGSLDFPMSSSDADHSPNLARSPSAVLLGSVAGLAYAMPMTPITQLPETQQHADRHLSPLCSGNKTGDSHCSCLEQALELMKLLFPQPTTYCTTSRSSSSAPLPPTASTVVERNRRTVEKVSAMLTCHCVHDAHLLALMAHIVFKVLGWYAAVVACRTTPPSSPPVTPYMEQVGWQAESVAGRYRLDGDNAGRMAAQLVLSELHRAQSLIRELSGKLEARAGEAQKTSGDKNSSGGSLVVPASGEQQPQMPFSGEILERLAVDLRVRFKELSVEIVRTLRKDLDASRSKADDSVFSQGRRTSR